MMIENSESILTWSREDDISKAIRIWRPHFPSRVPCVIWNHGSKGTGLSLRQNAAQLPNIVAAYLNMGLGVIMPSRQGYDGRDGKTIEDEISCDMNAYNQESKLLQRIKSECIEVIRCVELIKHYPWIASDYVLCSGYSFGAIISLLAILQNEFFCAGVVFSPGAIMWHNYPQIRKFIISTTQQIKVPVMVIQAENDFDLSPSLKLQEIFQQKNNFSHAKIYPPHGSNPSQAHNFYDTGVKFWLDDVKQFINNIITYP